MTDKRICPVCKEEYVFALEVKYLPEGKICRHDQAPVTTKYIYKSYGQQKEFMMKKENPFKKTLGPK